LGGHTSLSMRSTSSKLRVLSTTTTLRRIAYR